MRISELAQGIDQTPLTPYRQPIDCGKEGWQINVWGDEANANAHSKPRSVAIVSSESGFPQAILLDGQRILVDSIIDLWKLEDRWWTEQPQNSLYFQVFASGAQLTLCHNLDRGGWSQH